MTTPTSARRCSTTVPRTRWKPGAGGEYFDMERELVAGTDQHRYRVSAQVTFPLFSRRALARLNGIS